jgi:hypothetical protein
MRQAPFPRGFLPSSPRHVYCHQGPYRLPVGGQKGSSMNPIIAHPEQGTYAALIRWRGPDPAVELEIQCPGFANPREAACFAGSMLPTSPHRLRLSATRVELLLGSGGEYVNFPYDSITAWIMTPPEMAGDPRDPANPSRFQMHSHSALAAYRTAHGDYKRVWYAVLGPDGKPVRVEIDPCDLTLVVPEHR